MIRRDQIRAIYRERGPTGYLKFQEALLDGINPDTGKTLPEGMKKKRRDFSIRALWEGLVGPVEETLNYAQDQAGLVEVPDALREQVSTGAFPSAVGQLIAREVIEAFDNTEGFIGDQLVREFTSTHRGERVVGFTAAQGPKAVIEGQAYEDSTIAEKFVGSRETKRGRLISITEETVTFDQTGQVLDRAQGIGNAARQDRERRIVQGVIDHDSGNAVYQPNGTAEQLYSTGNNNVDTTTGALVDWTDIQSVLDFHANNVTDDREPDDTTGAQPLVWTPKILLTSLELAGTAAMVVQTGTSAALTTVAPNPLNMMLSTGIRALSSVFINSATTGDQWDDNSDWLLGDFQRQFRYKVIWPLQTFRSPAQNPEQWSRDVIAQFKVREYGDVMAVAEQFVVKVDIV